MNTSGLDFGTTNSTIGYNNGNNSELIQLSKGKNETRTVIFEDKEDKKFVVGDEGIKKFIEGDEGRLLQSLKSFLNSKEEVTTSLFFKDKKITELVSVIISDFKNKLEQILDENVDDVLIGRPVRFHDNDEKLDLLAEKRLKNAAKLAGFKNIEFQLEPLAAAKTYQETLKQGKEEKVIIADLGGGTSDFSLLNMKQNKMEVLGNTGIYIGGNNFDKNLSYNFFADYLGKGTMWKDMGKELEIPLIFYRNLSDWKKIHELGSTKSKTHIREYFGQSLDKERFGRLKEISEDYLIGYEYYENVERTKKELSRKNSYNGTFNMFQDPFNFKISRIKFEELIQNEVSRIIKTIEELLKQTGISGKDIDKIFLTGGTSFLPIIQNEIENLIGKGKIVNNDKFSSIGYGLTLESYERFR